ncbi:MAG: AraC family transcriptional regulator [Butyribacter sp.]|nr:AraC family transcriptional regulator [bacterium]MDY3854054.1 AraC family transcriptional regulator [Butyribacter sp.]
MGSKKEYEEKQRHGTVELPVGLHKMEYPEGTDVIFYLHWHQEFEFLVLTKGKILFTIQDNEYELNVGDGVFINSNLLHSARTVDGQACSFFAVVFSYEALEDDIHSPFAKKYIRPVLNGKYLLEEYLAADSPIGPHKELATAREGIPEIDEFPLRFRDQIQLSWQQEVIFWLSQISQCPEHELGPYELLVKSRLLSIWNLMYHHGKSNRKYRFQENASSERLAPVVAYMKENFAYEITLSELAEMIPMSEGQFCRVFKQHMKMSPMQYLLRYRILQSCRLLQETDKKIGEIANLTGFNNISYFNKVFLKTIGCTPKEYRNSSSY